MWQLIPEHRKFDPPVLAKVRELRRVLLEAAAAVTSEAHSIVFTNFLPPDREATIVDPNRDLAWKLAANRSRAERTASGVPLSCASAADRER